jgi:hypothetical protein
MSAACRDAREYPGTARFGARYPTPSGWEACHLLRTLAATIAAQASRLVTFGTMRGDLTSHDNTLLRVPDSFDGKGAVICPSGRLLASCARCRSRQIFGNGDEMEGVAPGPFIGTGRFLLDFLSGERQSRVVDLPRSVRVQHRSRISAVFHAAAHLRRFLLLVCDLILHNLPLLGSNECSLNSGVDAPGGRRRATADSHLVFSEREKGNADKTAGSHQGGRTLTETRCWEESC